MEIQSCNAKIALLNLGDGLAEKERDFKMNLEKLSCEIITRKEKKIGRGRKAFNSGTAYTWPVPFQVRQNRRFRNPGMQTNVPVPAETEDSDSSRFSVSSHNSSTSSRYLVQAKKRLKGQEQENQLAKRPGSIVRTNDPNGEGMVPSTSNAASAPTKSAFLGNQGTLRAGTIMAQFPTQTGGSQTTPQ